MPWGENYGLKMFRQEKREEELERRIMQSERRPCKLLLHLMKKVSPRFNKLIL